MPAPPLASEAILSRLDLKIARRLEGLLQGDHKSPFRGQGLDLADLREYQYHDDVRHMDWNVTARTQIAHVREYIEDREVTAWFLLDMSPSIDFESVSVSKRAVLAEFTALLCRFLARRGNRAGALLFSGAVEQVIAARGGRRQTHVILNALTRYRAVRRAPTNLAHALADAARMIRRRALVFVVSDFISPPGWEKKLTQLAARHDVVAVRLTDPLESRLPDLGLLTFQDSETGEQLFVDTHDSGFRRRFAAANAAREEALQAAFQAAGVDAIELSTEDDVADAVLRFADMRKHSAKHAARSSAMNHVFAGMKNFSWSRVAEFLPGISFEWPSFLWLLLLVPVFVGLYVLLLGRRKKAVVRYGNLGMVKQAMGGATWRRHIPPALLLAALTLLLLAVARPSAMVSLPSHRATVMLAMDVSGSMRTADVKPSRIEAAQKAAKEYIKEQPKDVVIGIVAFAGVAFLVQAPTTDRQALDAAIDRFELQRATAVGNGLLVSLQSLFPRENIPISSFNNGGFGGAGFGGGGGYSRFDRTMGSCGRMDDSGTGFSRALGSAPPGATAPKKHMPVEPGSYKNGVIILMTDGRTNSGCDPVDAAHLASEYGVRVYTIGFGTTRGGDVSFGGFAMRSQIDEDALKKIADITKGRYYHAASAEDLKAVYSLLTKQLVIETHEMEISSFFAAAAAVLMLVAAGLSLTWFGRIV